MQVFISWSGEQSQFVATFLERWFQQVIQAVDPWISTDIAKGSRWSPEIADRLEKSKIGIICLTRENLDSAWMLFESGALSKTKDAYVCTLLVGVKPADVDGPLAQFQHTTTEKEDLKKLVRTINANVLKCGEKGLPDPILDSVFETYWPELRDAFGKGSAPKAGKVVERRSDRDILEEMLEILRYQVARLAKEDQTAKETLVHVATSNRNYPKSIFVNSSQPKYDAKTWEAMREVMEEIVRRNTADAKQTEDQTSRPKSASQLGELPPNE